MSDELKAPFPWFGGKRRVAPVVWNALGPVQNYVEPFAGSLAVLLGRPDKPQCETVNDSDAYLANFWRAVSHDPDQVALLCDWPVNETDLLARHLWLVNEGCSRISKMEGDPHYYDAKVAAWWVWGINAWIGSGWCSGKGPWISENGEVRQLPHLGDRGRGVNRKRPHLGNRGQDKPSKETNPAALTWYFNALADRLRSVRVCCGDWSRVVTRGALAFGESVGVFLDPPYLGDLRTSDLYRVDDHTISNSVREWCIENGGDPRMRIVLAGYWDEHAERMPRGWRHYRYSANVSYQGTNSKGGNRDSRMNETLWFSPHCLEPQPELVFEPQVPALCSKT